MKKLLQAWRAEADGAAAEPFPPLFWALASPPVLQPSRCTQTTQVVPLPLVVELG